MAILADGFFFWGLDNDFSRLTDDAIPRMVATVPIGMIREEGVVILQNRIFGRIIFKGLPAAILPCVAVEIGRLKIIGGRHIAGSFCLRIIHNTASSFCKGKLFEEERSVYAWCIYSRAISTKLDCFTNGGFDLFVFGLRGL